MSSALFGPQAIAHLHEPAALDALEEDRLLVCLRERLGEHAKTALLLHALREARGHVSFAVNGYLRAALSQPATAGGEDFAPPPRVPAVAAAAAAAADVGASSSSAGVSAQAAAAGEEGGGGGGAPTLLNALPATALEAALAHLDAPSVCRAAGACQALRAAARSDAVWQRLFERRWRGVVYPTDDGHSFQCDDASCGGGGGRGSETAGALLHGGSAAAAAASTAAAADGGGGGASPSQPAAAPPPPAAAAMAAPAGPSDGNAVAVAPRGVPPQQQQHQQHHQQPPPPPPPRHRALSAAALDAAGSWRALFARQHAYCARRACPRCGADGAVLPIVYGCPSPALVAGMRARRLILGGDHLIPACHVWACAACRACYRTYPYGDAARWLADGDARAAAAPALAAAAAANGGGGGGGEQLMPYTYEL